MNKPILWLSVFLVLVGYWVLVNLVMSSRWNCRLVFPSRKTHSCL